MNLYQINDSTIINLDKLVDASWWIKPDGQRVLRLNFASPADRSESVAGYFACHQVTISSIIAAQSLWDHLSKASMRKP